MKNNLIRFCLLLFSAFSFPAAAQLYNFTNYSLEQGLPQSTVFSVHQDARGYLWLGTESGVARFNGFEFKLFDRSSGLPGNIVRSIVESADGNIWVGTDMGIGVFNGREWKQITSKDGLAGSAVIKLAPDKLGRIWVATNDAGINIISLTNDSISIENINDNNGLTANFVLDILHDSKGDTWLAMIGGINRISFENGKRTIQNIGDKVLLPSNLISCIDEDISGNLWFGTLDAGAFELSKAGDRYNLISFNDQKGINDPRIWDIFCDGPDQVWFGSNENGVYRWSKGIMQNITSKNGLPGNLILSIFRDKDRNLWFGSMNGLSLFKGFHLVHYTSADGLPGTQVLAVKESPDHYLWVGGDGKGLARISLKNDKLVSRIFDKSSGFLSTQVTSIDFDSNGNLLAGTRGDGLAMMRNGTFSYLKVQNGLADDNINCVYNNVNGSIYAGTNLGYNEIKTDKIHTISEAEGLINPEVQTVISDLKGDIWMGTMGGLARFNPVTENYRDFNEAEGLFDLRIHALVVDKLNQLYIGTNNGIYRYDELLDTITPFLTSALNSKTINSLLFYDDTVLIVGTNLGFNNVFFEQALTTPLKVTSYDKMTGFKFSETNLNAISKDASNHVWFGTVNGLTRYCPDLEDTTKVLPVVHITGIRLSFEAVDWNSGNTKTEEWFNLPGELSLKYNQNHITFDFDGIYLRNPEKVRFRYKLEPNESNWSPPTASKSFTYPWLNNGQYTFWVSASADEINWSKPILYKLTLRPPFWKTLWFYILLTGGIIALLFFYIRYREKKLVQEKEHLEKIVTERTAEVVAQKEQIQKQHKIVSEQKLEITSSITYARRIQQAVLPGLDILAENTSDSFVLYKPRDIVSGDFYWIGKSENNLIITAADCTGHGVPGAFMSMLGISFMNKIIREQKIIKPELVLGQMRNNVINSMHQGDYEGTTKDGMDMALCVIDLNTLTMSYAGAFNPAVIVSDNEAIELKANRMPVGFHIEMSDFTPQTVKVKKGDCIYLFTDGFQDQMGGPDGKKFMRKNLRELLLGIHSKPFTEQKKILEKTLEEWQKSIGFTNEEIEQMDDILVLGFMV